MQDESAKLGYILINAQSVLYFTVENTINQLKYRIHSCTIGKYCTCFGQI